MQSLIMIRRKTKMLSGFEIFKFFVSDHLNVTYIRWKEHLFRIIQHYNFFKISTQKKSYEGKRQSRLVLCVISKND